MSNSDLMQDYLDLYDKYKAKLVIDKHSLDNEGVAQAQLFADIAEKHVECASHRDEAYQTYKITEAQQNLRMRQDALDEGRKVTETMLESLVITSRPYQIAKDAHLTWKALADKWEALRESAAQRSYILKDLAALWLGGYYSSASTNASQNVVEKRVAQEVRAVQAEHRERKRLARKDS